MFRNTHDKMQQVTICQSKCVLGKLETPEVVAPRLWARENFCLEKVLTHFLDSGKLSVLDHFKGDSSFTFQGNNNRIKLL